MSWTCLAALHDTDKFRVDPDCQRRERDCHLKPCCTPSCLAPRVQSQECDFMISRRQTLGIDAELWPRRGLISRAFPGITGKASRTGRAGGLPLQGLGLRSQYQQGRGQYHEDPHVQCVSFHSLVGRQDVSCRRFSACTPELHSPFLDLVRGNRWNNKICDG